MTLHFTTSHSEINTYQNCRRKHYYSYGMQLGPKESVTPHHFVRGTIGHLILETFFKARKDGKSYEESVQLSEVAMAEQTLVDAKAVAEIIKSLKVWFGDHREQVESWEVLEIEEPRFMMLDEHNRMIFIPDLVFVENGKVRIADWKFTYDFWRITQLEMDPQVPKYIAGLKDDYVIGSGYYVQFRTRQMKEPEPKDLVKVDLLQPTPARLCTVTGEQLALAKEIAYFKGLPIDEWGKEAVRNISKDNCRNCIYQAICMMEMNGSNPNAEIKWHFEKRTPSEFRALDGVEH